MKITDGKVTPPLGQKNRNWVLVKVITNAGIVGLGEGAAGLSVDHLKRLLHIGDNVSFIFQTNRYPNQRW